MLLAWPFNRVAPSMNSFQSIRPWWKTVSGARHDCRVVSTGESFLDGHPHAIRFSYFGEVPECLTLKDHIEVYVRKLIVVIQIISLSFIDYRDVEDTKHPKHTYSSSP